MRAGASGYFWNPRVILEHIWLQRGCSDTTSVVATASIVAVVVVVVVAFYSYKFESKLARGVPKYPLALAQTRMSASY